MDVLKDGFEILANKAVWNVEFRCNQIGFLDCCVNWRKLRQGTTQA